VDKRKLVLEKSRAAHHCPLQNLIHVFLAQSPMKIEENCIFKDF
jgi:hypothetical protein